MLVSCRKKKILTAAVGKEVSALQNKWGPQKLLCNPKSEPELLYNYELSRFEIQWSKELKKKVKKMDQSTEMRYLCSNNYLTIISNNFVLHDSRFELFFIISLSDISSLPLEFRQGITSHHWCTLLYLSPRQCILGAWFFSTFLLSPSKDWCTKAKTLLSSLASLQSLLFHDW